VEVIHQDAFQFLKIDQNYYDIIIVDLPDPSSEGLARLYSSSFYKLCLNRLSPKGVLSTQATSPELSTNAFWCINTTLKNAGFAFTYPYGINIPSFGNWGFIIAKKNPKFVDTLRQDIYYKFLENEMLEHIFYFPKDVRVENIQANHLDKPIILDYYLNHWQSLQGQKITETERVFCLTSCISSLFIILFELVNLKFHIFHSTRMHL